MTTHPTRRETLTEAFERGIEKFNAMTSAEKLRFFQEIGAWSEDGRLTTRYGGDAPVFDEAIAAREQQSHELFASIPCPPCP